MLAATITSPHRKPIVSFPRHFYSHFLPRATRVLLATGHVFAGPVANCQDPYLYTPVDR